ncbi:MAG TPA: lysophospholipid acyltransferase family protein [Sphingomicrobium sp.]|nr:lysophospholipid acyltransferase family protein [Sphingomicrobium sp.]
MTASAERPSSKLLFGLRLAGLVGLFLAYVPPHLLSKWLLRRSGWPPRFLRHAGLIAGVRPRVEGNHLEPHTFVIANHTSWLDILVMGGWTGTAFVSKAELKATPLLGWIADQNRTFYIDRSARRDSHGQVKLIVEALAHHQPLAVFPEGTTGNGRHLLPFRSTLLEAVAPPPKGVTVRPVALDYGEHADIVGWHSGESGIANFRRVLGHRGTMAVTIRLLDPLPPDADRKTLARHARQSISAALSSLHARDAL